MLSDLLFRLLTLFRRDAVEAELDHQLRSHLKDEVAKHVAAGLPRDEAERRVRLALGVGVLLKPLLTPEKRDGHQVRHASVLSVARLHHCFRNTLLINNLG